MKARFLKAILSVPTSQISHAVALPMLFCCYKVAVQRWSLAYIVFPHTCLCSVKKFHLSLRSFCNFTHSFAPPSALPCPSLSFFFSPPLLFLSGTFQVVTHIATVTLQSPTSPTWLAPFCWWISSSTSKGVEEVEGAVCKPITGREGGNRDGRSRDVYFSALSNIKASVALISSLKYS